ncbi:MAG: hypothetical protein NXI32_02770, partial [bacterium]|nr:hypothetical protein [bacterium]
ALVLDMVLSDARAVAPGTPYFLLPGPAPGFDQNTANFHARQSYLGAQVNGPRVGSFQSGGNILVYFYNDNAFADAYGILPLQAYGELRNERWRFAAGYQFDVFNPGVPTVLPFSALLGSGNTGNAARGQLRVERYFATTQSSQWTLQCALSEPITTLIDPNFGLSEDNGWPNFEARLAYALGAVQANGQRPFEIGVSGIVGQIRNTVFNSDAVALQRFVTDVWGVGADFRWRLSDFLGVTAEVYSGQGLGTYNGGALQLVNPDEDFGGIRSTGGFGEVYTYWTPRLHSHFGFGIDDPLDSTVAVTPRLLGRTLNSTGYANAIFDVTPSFRVAFEVARRETRFLSPAVPDNAGTFFQSQVAFTF